MEAFAYLSVLLSIIIGLGMTQVLTTAGRLIRRRHTVLWYWPPLVWAAAVLIIDIQVWWSMFALRTETVWTFAGFLVVLLQTVALYMVAALVLPDGDAEWSAGHMVDLRADYEQQSAWFFGFLAAMLVISLLKGIVLDGHLPAPLDLAFHLLFLTMCAAAMVVRRTWYHELTAAAGAAAIAAYIALLFSRLR